MDNPRTRLNRIISLLWLLFLFLWFTLDFYQGTHGYLLPLIWWYHPVSTRSTSHHLWYHCKSVHIYIQNGLCGTRYSSLITKNSGSRGGGTPISGIGILKWRLHTGYITLAIHSHFYHVPNYCARLLSPQWLFRTRGGATGIFTTSLLVTSVLLSPWVVNCLLEFRMILSHIVLLSVLTMLLPQILQLRSIFWFFLIKIKIDSYPKYSSPVAPKVWSHKHAVHPTYILYMFIHSPLPSLQELENIKCLNFRYMNMQRLTYIP